MKGKSVVQLLITAAIVLLVVLLAWILPVRHWAEGFILWIRNFGLAGAFIYGLLQEWTLEDVIRFAHAVAAIKCMHIGARRGIPTISEVQRFLLCSGGL